jgi:hypothetical protein
LKLGLLTVPFEHLDDAGTVDTHCEVAVESAIESNSSVPVFLKDSFAVY